MVWKNIQGPQNPKSGS